MKTAGSLLGILMGLFTTVIHGFEPGDYKIIDLSYAYDKQTIYWPTSPSTFQLQQLSHGPTEAGFFYSANAFSTPEHGGTHIDAPIHFHEQGQTVDRIPLEHLVLPGVLIDISDKTAADRNYRLQAEDVQAFEAAHGQIAAGTAVLVRTGWSQYWPDVKQYLGDDTPGDASRLEFPSFGEDAARLLVEQRRVALIGIDTASIDYGRSRDFIVHRIAASHNVAGLENLTQLEMLPTMGFTLIALPMKIEGGSGGPTRVIALVPDLP